MTRLAPVSREELIRKLRILGFQGPFTGGRHEFMARKGVRLIIRKQRHILGGSTSMGQGSLGG